MRYQHFTQHLCRNIADFSRTSPNMYSPFETVFECPFATSSSVNLRFHDNLDVAKFTRYLFCLIHSRGDPATGSRYVEFLQQFFGLVFVNIHR
jgi:hypothetical protein